MIEATDLVLYGTSSKPEDDETGATALIARLLDARFSAAARPEIVSTEGADTPTDLPRPGEAGVRRVM